MNQRKDIYCDNMGIVSLLAIVLQWPEGYAPEKNSRAQFIT